MDMFHDKLALSLFLRNNIFPPWWRNSLNTGWGNAQHLWMLEKYFRSVQCPKAGTTKELKMQASLASSGTDRFFIVNIHWYKTRYYLLSYNLGKILFESSLGKLASSTSSPELFNQHQTSLHQIDAADLSFIISRRYSQSYLSSFSEHKFYVDASFGTDPNLNGAWLDIFLVLFVSGRPVSWKTDTTYHCRSLQHGSQI